MKEPTLFSSLICDDVIRHHDGKASVIGIFEKINSERFPAIHPKFSIYCRWGAGVGDHTIQTRLLDPSKKNVLHKSNKQQVNFPNEAHSHNDVWYLVGASFESPGTYWIEVLLNDKPVRYVQFELVKITKQ